MSAGALIFRNGAVLGKGKDLCGIPFTVRAVNAHRIISLFLTFLGCLCTEAVQDIKNFSPLLQRLNHIFRIFPGTVHLRLITVIHVDAEALHGFFKFHFEMLCIIGTAVVKGIGHVHIRVSDIFFPGLLTFRTGKLGYIHRDFTESVKFIPGKQKPGFLSLASQRLYHKIAGCDISEISYMDGAGRADAGCTYIFLFIRTAPDNFLRNSVRPMHNFLVPLRFFLF